jgi:hypothetical protein
VGAGHLKGLVNLTGLYLSGTKVTDAGIKGLYGLKKLTFLDLSRTKVTDKGVETLKKALPDAFISE